MSGGQIREAGVVLPALPLVITAPTLMWQPTACSAVAEHGTTMLNAAYSE